MGKRSIQALSLLLTALFAGGAFAQLDPSAVLLRPNGKSSSSTKNLDSNRYKVRVPESRKDHDDIEEKPGTMIPSPVPAKISKTKITAPGVSVEMNSASETKTAPAPAPATVETVPSPVIETNQPVETLPAPVAAPRRGSR